MSCFDQEYYAGLVRVGYRDTIGGSTTWITDKITTDSEINYELNPVETSTGEIFGGRILTCNIVFAGNANLNELLTFQRHKAKKYVEFLFDDGRAYITSEALSLITEDRLLTNAREGVNTYSVKFSNIGKKPLFFVPPALSFEIDTELGDGDNTFSMQLKGECVTVGWGDGGEESFESMGQDFYTRTHTYNSAGKYKISLFGFLTGIRFNNIPEGKRLKVIGGEANTWGYHVYNSVSFLNCENYAPEYADTPDLGNMSVALDMFRGCSSFNGNVSEWGVRNITNFENMFLGCSSFTGDVSQWKPKRGNFNFIFADCTLFNSDVTWTPEPTQPVFKPNSVSGMFRGCETLGSGDNSTSMFRDWNMSVVPDLNFMFEGCKNINPFMSSWNIVNVTSMVSTFEGCTSFNSPVTNWDTRNLINATNAFRGCTALSNNANFSGWDTGRLELAAGMFRDCTQFNADLSSWDTSSLQNASGMFNGCVVFNRDISSWDTSSLVNANGMFFGASSFNQPLDSWNVSNVTNMNAMFHTTKDFNQNLNSWNTFNVQNMQSMFYGTESFNGDIGQWDTSNVTTMASMFRLSNQFNKDINNWNVSSVASFDAMFEDAQAFNQPLDKWDVSGATSLRLMFRSALAFDQNIGMWNITNVGEMTAMFDNSAMSEANMSKTIIGWANRALFDGVQRDVNVGFTGQSVNGLTYNDAYRATDSGAFNDGLSAKAYLENTWNWSFVEVI